ncbi:MAG: hypothetical protein KGN16_17400 [Burkholderiales bacterium]|nr:hypothetical protein [Burkholderiales bacterium]
MALLDGGRAPRRWSLVGRLTGGVVLIALLSFAAQAVVLALWLVPVTDDLAGVGAEQATMVQAALAAVPAEQRPALARKLSNGWVTVTSQLPSDAGAIAPVPQRDLPVSEILRREIQVRFARRPGQRFAAIFRLQVDGQDWWMTRAYSALPGAVTGTIGIWLVVLGVATVGALLLSVRFIARPFARLAAQISHQHGALQPLPETGDASAELRSLVRAFNDLVRQVTAASQGRQQLLAGVSHDLRTPLARLRLRAETQCEPEVADALTADLLALERIVDQFLAYVQGDNGLALGTREPLERTVSDLVGRYAGTGQDVVARIEAVAAEVPDVAVQRLLSNLIDNAYAHGGGPVEVALRTLADGTVELAVYDRGSGMTEEEFARAQQPFVRLTNSRSQLGHCGLGLAIVGQIARQLGGRLRLVRAEDGRFGIALALPPA